MALSFSTSEGVYFFTIAIFSQIFSLAGILAWGLEMKIEERKEVIMYEGKTKDSGK